MFVVQLEIGCRDLTCMLSMSSTVTIRVILADCSLLDLGLQCFSALSWDPLLIDSECHISFQFCSLVFSECAQVGFYQWSDTVVGFWYGFSYLWGSEGYSCPGLCINSRSFSEFRYAKTWSRTLHVCGAGEICIILIGFSTERDNHSHCANE